MAEIIPEVGGHPGGAGELRDVAVQIHAVDTFKFVTDVFLLESGNGVWYFHADVRLGFCYTPLAENTSRWTAQSGPFRGGRYAARPDITPPGN